MTIKRGDRVKVKDDAPSPLKGVEGIVLPDLPGVLGCVIVNPDSSPYRPFQIHTDYLDKI